VFVPSSATTLRAEASRYDAAAQEHLSKEI